jgi:hypothetical protein
VPEFAASLLLPRAVGHLKAAELLLLAEAIDGEEALRLGLANRVLAPADLLPFAREQGLKLAAKPPMALQKSKALLKQELKQAVHFVIDLEARLRPGPARGRGAKPHRQQAAKTALNSVETEPAYQLAALHPVLHLDKPGNLRIGVALQEGEQGGAAAAQLADEGFALRLGHWGTRAVTSSEASLR